MKNEIVARLINEDKQKQKEVKKVAIKVDDQEEESVDTEV